MTDIQAWRRSAQLSRPRANDVPERPDLIPDPTLSGNASLSTSPVDSTRPRAKKSLASFSALLNTNRAISSTGTPRWPSIDWSNLNDNDEVYKPDIDFMLSTLQHFCLANPSQDLPARYSGPLLHVLEAFRQLKADNESLKSGMEEQIRCHQDDLDRLHCVFISLWGKKLCRLPHQAHAKSFMEDTESLTQLPARKDEACCKKEQAGPGDRLEEGEVQPLLSEQKTLPTNGKGMMALASGSYHVGMPRKLSTSGMESDLLSAQGDQLLWSTVQDTKGAKGYSSPEMHLAEWLASRVGCSLDEAQFELTQILRSFPHWLMQLGDREALPNALANSPSECVAAMTQQMAGVQERQTNNARNNSSVSSMTRRGQGHRRGFSFLPGDDSVKTMLLRTKEDTESGDLVSTPLPGCQNRESGCDNVSETSKDISTPRLPPSLKAYQQSIKSVVAPAVQTAATQFQRDDCSKGILSTIRRSSGRSSTSSRRDSASSNIEPSSLRATKISGNNHFAIAAARAAKVSQTTRTAIDTSI